MYSEKIFFEQHLSLIEKIINSKKIDFIHIADKETRNIINQLLKLGKINLIKKYVDKIYYKTEINFNEETGKTEESEVPYFRFFTFVPSINEFYRLTSELFANKCDNSYSVLLFLKNLSDYWKKSIKKMHQHENYINTQRKANNQEFLSSKGFFLLEQSYLEEMYDIKSNKKIDNLSTNYFSENRADKCLNFILKEVIKYQANHNHTPVQPI